FPVKHTHRFPPSNGPRHHATERDPCHHPAWVSAVRGGGTLPACCQAAIGVPGRSDCGVTDGVQLVDPLLRYPLTDQRSRNRRPSFVRNSRRLRMFIAIAWVGPRDSLTSKH